MFSSAPVSGHSEVRDCAHGTLGPRCDSTLSGAGCAPLTGVPRLDGRVGLADVRELDVEDAAVAHGRVGGHVPAAMAVSERHDVACSRGPAHCSSRPAPCSSTAESVGRKSVLTGRNGRQSYRKFVSPVQHCIPHLQYGNGYVEMQCEMSAGTVDSTRLTTARCPRSPCYARTTTRRGRGRMSPRGPCSSPEKERRSLGKLWRGSADATAV